MLSISLCICFARACNGLASPGVLDSQRFRLVLLARQAIRIQERVDCMLSLGAALVVMQSIWVPYNNTVCSLFSYNFVLVRLEGELLPTRLVAPLLVSCNSVSLLIEKMCGR